MREGRTGREERKDDRGGKRKERIAKNRNWEALKDIPLQEYWSRRDGFHLMVEKNFFILQCL